MKDKNDNINGVKKVNDVKDAKAIEGTNMNMFYKFFAQLLLNTSNYMLAIQQGQAYAFTC